MIDKVKGLIAGSTWGQRYNALLTVVVLVLSYTVMGLRSDRQFLYTHVHGGEPQQQQRQQENEWAGWLNNNKPGSAKCPSCNGTGRSSAMCGLCRGSGRSGGSPCSYCAGTGHDKCYRCSR